MTLYAYVGGAPTSRRDPLGLRWTGGDLAVSAPGVDCADSTPHGGMPGCGQSASDGAPLLSILFPGAVLTAPAPSVAAITVIGLGGAWLVYKMLEAISAPRTVSLSEAEQDKKLTDGEIDRLQSWDIDIHDLKGKVGASKRELFKDVQGNIKVKPRSGKGEGEPTGLNINDFPPRPRR